MKKNYASQSRRGLVHARIDQEVGGAFRDRGADP
jgi:hypothetical protein